MVSPQIDVGGYFGYRLLNNDEKKFLGVFFQEDENMSRDGGGARAGGRHGFAFDSFIFKKKNQDFVEVQMSSLAMVFLNNPETPKPCGEHMTACP